MATIITSGATLNGTQIVSSGELTISTTVMGALGNQIIENGGSASITTINPNGFQQIKNGGSVTSTIISANGGQIVSSGGFAEVTVINWLGVQLVDVGGSATSTTLDGGTQQIRSNAIVTSTTINDAGGQIISAGGIAENTTVNSSGVQQINSGGSAVNTIVNNNGTQQALGGVIINATVNGGYQLVFSNGIAQSTVINSAQQQVSNGGYVINTTINGGDRINVGQVILDGSAVSTIINNASQYVSSGGLAQDTIISGGNQYVFNGGMVKTTIIDGGGQQITSGALAENTTINNSGVQQVDISGSAVDTIVNDDGTQQIYGGAVLSTVINVGRQLIFSGGTAQDTTIYSGIQAISSGFTTNTVISGGYSKLSNIGQAISYGSAINNIITDAQQRVFVGGTVISSVINGDDGKQLIYSGGTAQSTTVNNAAGQLIDVGGVSEFTTLNDSAIQQIESGGSAVNTVINDEAIQQAYGGAIVNATVNGGYQLVFSNGTAENTIVYSGNQQISNGGLAISNVISGDYAKQQIYAGGTAQITIIDNNGAQYISSGGIAENTIINSGGQLVYSGGLAEFTTVNSNGAQQIESGGSAVSTTVNDNGIQQAYGGTVVSTTISNAKQLIFSNGSAQDTTIYNGIQQISSGVTINTIVSGGYSSFGYVGQDIYYGSAISNSINNAQQRIFIGGVAQSTTIDNNGGQLIGSGGVAKNTLIYNGMQEVESNGYVIDTTIYNSGIQYIYEGGLASNTTVNDGGIQSVYTGGSINNTTINNGGVLIINNGATLDGIATLNLGGSATIYPQVGGTIDLAGNTNAGLTISGLEDGGEVTTVISGFNGDSADNSDAIQLAGIYTSNVTNVAYEDADGNQSGDYVTLTLNNNSKITLNIIGAQDAGYSLGSAPDGSLTYEVCFLSGSMIRAAEGEIAVENIRIGDQVLTFDWETNQEIVRPVRWVGSKRITVNPNLMDDEAGYPVRILKNAISDGVPYKDLLITSEHSLFFNNTLIPVRMLVNGYSIYYDYSITNYTYYHIETESHSVIWADGMLTETYLDTGNRAQFRQHGDCAVLTPSIIQQDWKQDAVAPLMIDRNVVEPLYNQLLQRAASMKLPMMQSEKQFTDDPGLHLLMEDGSIIQPVSNYYKGQYTFLLPDEDIGSVYLVSRASRFSDIIGPFVDNRHYLGVWVGNINILAFDQSKNIKMHTITDHLNQADLPGWHGIEATPHRWTNGKALLNIPKDDLKKRRLIVHVCSDRSYVINDRTKDQSIAI